MQLTTVWFEAVPPLWSLWLLAAVLYACMIRDIAAEVRGE